jgi:hypothetical protein
MPGDRLLLLFGHNQEKEPTYLREVGLFGSPVSVSTTRSYNTIIKTC